jgi:hypothetical protein
MNPMMILGVKSGNSALVQVALAQGADPNSRGTGYRMQAQLIFDCFGRLLIKTIHTSEKAPCALFLAVSSEHENQAIINDLLKSGADPNARGDYYEANDNMSALILFCAVSGDQQAI